MLNRVVLALPIIFCWGCVAQLTQQGSAVGVADENIVRQCQYLGDVFGGVSRGSTPDYDGTFRTSMRNSAATMGATHVVFVSQTLARAYRCPAQAQAPSQGDGAGSDHVAKVRAREQAAGAAADQD
jgi:hypothetical protein